MGKYTLVAFIVFAAIGCGKQEIEVKPITGDINVHHKLELEDVKMYFTAECEDSLPQGYTQAELDQCVDIKMGKFLTTGFGV